MANKQAANDFALNLGALTGTLRKRTDSEIGKLVLNLYTRVVIGTPTDLGVARSNWNLSLGNADESFSSDVKEVDSMISDAESKLINLSGAQTIHITNATVYIRRLEEGHSKQKPNGWVKVAVERTRKRLS